MRPTLRRPAPSAVIRDAASPVIESLESRCLLSTTFANGVVQVVATNGNDNIFVHVYYAPAGDGTDVAVLRIEVNGRVQNFGGVTGLSVDARGGDDRIFVDSRNVPAGMEAISTTLLGGDGNDDIRGSLTSDLIVGGAGDDDLYDGGAGHDSMFGGTGSDFLYGGHRDQRNMYLCSGPDNDIVAGGNERPVYDHLESGDGRDTNDDPAGLVAVQRGTNFLRADGVLFVIGGESDDDVRIAVDDPSYFANIRRIRILTGGGNDRIQVFARNLPAGIDVEVDAGDGDDTILTAGGDDTIVSGAGHDVIDAGGGANVTDQGPDDVSWNSAGALHLDGSGNVVIDGTAFADQILAYWVDGGATYEFWVNNTRYRVPAAGVTGTIVNAGDGDDLVRTDTPDDLPYYLSTTVYGGAGDDTITGGIGADYFDGGDGNDYLYDHKADGRAGVLIGGAGDDTLGPSAQQIGGAGENLILADNYPNGYAYLAIAGTDGTGSVEPQVGWFGFIPDEYNPVAVEAWVLDPLLPQDVDLVDDGYSGYWRTSLCTVSTLLPEQVAAAPTAGAEASTHMSVSLGPLAGVDDPVGAGSSDAAAALPDSDGLAATGAYAPPPSPVSAPAAAAAPGLWAEDPITHPWDDATGS